MSRRSIPPPQIPPPVDPADQPLTDAEKVFVEEYLIHFKRARAYLAAHPHCSRASAYVLGTRWLQKVRIRAEIDAVVKERRKHSEITASRVLRAAADIAFADIADCYGTDAPLPIRQIPIETRRALQSVKVHRRQVTTGTGKKKKTVSEQSNHFRLTSKAQALILLFQHLGLHQELPPVELLLSVLPRQMAEEFPPPSRKQLKTSRVPASVLPDHEPIKVIASIDKGFVYTLIHLIEMMS